MNLSQKKAGVRRVVIDAGHGGHDPGTMGKRTKEKDIALAIALRLGKMIQDNYPETEVIYTRKTDVFVELYRRAQIANEKKADLFISIHCNGTRSPEARGVETWVMGLHKSKENLEVAKKENASILMEDNLSRYDGFDPNSPEANIIFSLYQNVYLDQSLAMATGVQSHFQNGLGLLNRGVKQAGFWVLYKTTMPGILVEAGFLSNSSDEEYLLSEKGQNNIAGAIFNAFSEYAGEKAVFAPETKKVTADTPVAVNIPEKKYPDDPASSLPLKPSGKNDEVAGNSKVTFKVQFLTAPEKIPENASRFKGVKGAKYYIQKGVYKYTVGECSSLEDAIKLQSQIQSKGFKDAFVVAFYQGERITLEQARKHVGQ